MRRLSDELIDRMLAQHDARPKVVELGLCDWPREVFDAFMAQDPQQTTHHVAPGTATALDTRELAACGVPVTADQVAPEDQQPVCIACAIARGARPESFISASAA